MSDSEYRKKVPSPLFLYNTYNQLYRKYFYNQFIRSGKKIGNPHAERILKGFTTNYWNHIKTIDRYKKYVMWIFQEHGKVSIMSIHRYVEGWEETESADMNPFANKMAKYIRDHKLKTFKEYIKPRKNTYPYIIQHYVGMREFPFEAILYLGVMDKIDKNHIKILKALLAKELYNKKQHAQRLEENKVFIDNEINRIVKLI